MKGKYTHFEEEALLNEPIRILLVDDSPYFLEAAHTFLSIHRSVKVIDSAMSATEAMEKIRQLQLDIILLDIKLGEASGLDLIPFIREVQPQTKIIVLTILNEASYYDAALHAGADAFVAKPVMAETLLPVIHRLMTPPAAGADAGPKALLDKESLI